MTQTDVQTAGRRPRRWKRRLAVAMAGLCIVAACVSIRYFWGTEEASAEPQGQASAGKTTDNAAAKSPGGNAALNIMATVDGEPISRQELANECLLHYGKEVLEKLKGKYLILIECQRTGISVTQQEVNDEIERYAKRFQVDTASWLKLLKQERGITPTQYSSDIIWPMLALRKLAGGQLKITAEELAREYETTCGPQVKVRLIMCAKPEKARQVRAEAAADPAQFGELAVKYSEDAASASLKGLIQPIRKNMVSPKIEQVAFGMKDGEVSDVIDVGGQFVVLFRESLIPARQLTIDQVRPQLELAIRDRKERELSGEIFKRLESTCKFVPVFTDPALSPQYPGVAAYINDKPVMLQELAERCLERYGEQALEGTINRRLLEQDCKKKSIVVNQTDLDKEIVRAASTMLPPKADGSADVETWLKMNTEQQGVSEELYRHDMVWPSVALKKLVGEKVEVAKEDLQKGFEANFGPRVRCLAIIMDNMHRAQEVWEKARQNPTPEYFGQLAEQYSIEASSRSLKGQVPPIQMHGGQPKLEDEAFRLQQGQLSGIVQMGDKCIILYCLGRTEPKAIDFALVKDEIYRDVHEKKLRVLMADYFQQLQDNATIDNFLAGTSHSPKGADAKSASKAGKVTR